MNRLYQKLKTVPPGIMFQSVRLTEDENIEIFPGYCYGDQTSIVINISESGQKWILSDGGRTRDCMDREFELKAPDVIKNILILAGYYGVSTADQRLSLVIETPDQFAEGYYTLLACINSLDSMKNFYR